MWGKGGADTPPWPARQAWPEPGELGLGGRGVGAGGGSPPPAARSGGEQLPGSRCCLIYTVNRMPVKPVGAGPGHRLVLLGACSLRTRSQPRSNQVGRAYPCPRDIRVTDLPNAPPAAEGCEANRDLWHRQFKLAGPSPGPSQSPSPCMLAPADLLSTLRADATASKL